MSWEAASRSSITVMRDILNYQSYKATLVESNDKDRSPLKLSESILFKLNRTFIDTVAETTLVAATAINKLHVGTHIGLASVAADWACVTVIHDVQWRLHREQRKRYFATCCTKHILSINSVTFPRLLANAVFLSLNISRWYKPALPEAWVVPWHPNKNTLCFQNENNYLSWNRNRGVWIWEAHRTAALGTTCRPAADSLCTVYLRLSDTT